MRDRTLAYAEAILDEVAGDPGAVDLAMETGYAWRDGPFAMLGRRPPPPRRPGVGTLADVKREREPVRRNGSASLWELGDGVLCLEFHTKMNAIDPGIIGLAAEAIALAPTALVIHNDGERFSVGANLAGVLLYANTAAWHDLDLAIRAGQDVFAALRTAPFPVVGAPSGMALGGGCEILLHCDAIQAHAESYIGLPEVGRRDRARLGRLPAPPRAADGAGAVRADGAGAGGVRDDRAGEGVDVGRRGAGARLPPARRPDHDEPRPRARRREGAFALELADGYTPPEPVELRLPGRPAPPRSRSASRTRRWPAGRCRTIASCWRRSRTCSPAATPIPPCP